MPERIGDARVPLFNLLARVYISRRIVRFWIAQEVEVRSMNESWRGQIPGQNKELGAAIVGS